MSLGRVDPTATPSNHERRGAGVTVFAALRLARSGARTAVGPETPKPKCPNGKTL